MRAMKSKYVVLAGGTRQYAVWSDSGRLIRRGGFFACSAAASEVFKRIGSIDPHADAARVMRGAKRMKVPEWEEIFDE